LILCTQNIYTKLIKAETNQKEVHSSTAEYLIDCETHNHAVCCQMFNNRVVILCLALTHSCSKTVSTKAARSAESPTPRTVCRVSSPLQKFKAILDVCTEEKLPN
jgi:hypothetical protein